MLKEKARMRGTDNNCYNEPRYDTYRMSAPEKLLYALIASVATFILCYVCYRSYPLAAVASLMGAFYPPVRRRRIIKDRKKELNLQFKDMLYALSSSLAAGSPVEKAFGQLPDDLSLIYPDCNEGIVKEARLISLKLEMNVPIEAALDNFARRSGVEDIEAFADVFRTSKRSGANMVEVMRNTTNIINDRIEIGQEIETMLAERKFEQKVLYVLPPVMIALLSFTAPDYMEPVFSTAAGRVAMSAAIALIALAFFISARINEINI